MLHFVLVSSGNAHWNIQIRKIMCYLICFHKLQYILGVLEWMLHTTHLYNVYTGCMAYVIMYTLLNMYTYCFEIHIICMFMLLLACCILLLSLFWNKLLMHTFILIGVLIDWYIFWLVYWFVHWLMYWLMYWCVDCLIDWLVDRLLLWFAEGKARIRVQLSAAHSLQNVDLAVDAFIEIGKQLKVIPWRQSRSLRSVNIPYVCIQLQTYLQIFIFRLCLKSVVWLAEVRNGIEQYSTGAMHVWNNLFITPVTVWIYQLN